MGKEVVSDGHVNIELRKGGKVISTGDYDRGAGKFFMNVKGEKGQVAFDMPKDILKIKEDVIKEGRMKELHGYIADGKPAEWIAKKMKLDVKTIKALMAGYGEAYEIGTDEYRKYLEDLTPMEGARSDAMRAMRKDKDFNKKDTADDDDRASDSDRKAASKNVFSQLLKSVDSGGKTDVVFKDKKKVKVSAAIAKQVIKKSQSFRRPKEKLEFQNKIQTSYRDLLKALKEENNEPLTILDRIDTKIKERKNG